MFRQREDGQPGGGVAIAGDALGQRGFRPGEIIRRPDLFQLASDTLADFGVWGVMNGISGRVELAALPCGAARNGATGGTQAAVVVGDDVLDPAQPASDQVFED